MIDFEVSALYNSRIVIEIGEWLDGVMPNPPLPDEQRWSVGWTNGGSGRIGIRIANDDDATIFALRWGCQ